jgi:hypothetical protein
MNPKRHSDGTAEEIWEAICGTAAKEAGIPIEQAQTILAAVGYSADHHTGVVPACKIVAYVVKHTRKQIEL